MMGIYLGVMINDEGEDKVYLEDSKSAVRFAVTNNSPIKYFEIGIDESTKEPFISEQITTKDFSNGK